MNEYPTLKCGMVPKLDQDYFKMNRYGIRIVVEYYAEATGFERPDITDVNWEKNDPIDEDIVMVDKLGEAEGNFDEHGKEFDYESWKKDHAKDCKECYDLIKPWEKPRPEDERKITEFTN